MRIAHLNERNIVHKMMKISNTVSGTIISLWQPATPHLEARS
jgi:hypothetical protein